jgi:putative membrane protein
MNEQVLYQFLGMHFIGWFFWIILFSWIFLSPFKIPYQKSAKHTPLDSLKMQLAEGLIHKNEFEDKRRGLK